MKLAGAYVLRARVEPVVLVVAPAAVLPLGFIPSVTWPSSAWLLVGAAVVTLLGSLGRDAGKASQPALWAGWDGAPTTRRLRIRDSSNDKATERLHRLIAGLPNELEVPDREAEQADPAASDAAYEVIVGSLRALTRDRSRFWLVHAENTEYGFRRNLRALKRPGVVVSVATLVVTVVAGVPLGVLVLHAAAFALLAPAAASLLALSLWRNINDAWVRVPAEAYADALMNAVEELAQPVAVPAPSASP